MGPDLNTEVFTRLRRELPARIFAVRTPVFIHELPVPYQRIKTAVSSERFVLPVGSIEERINAAHAAVRDLVGEARWAFFYTPILPLCPHLQDGTPNRVHMVVRMATTHW